MKKARIVIVEDHFITREGLKALLDDQDDMEVVAVGKDGAEAVTLFRTHKPDLVLLDLRMPRYDGVQACAAILREDPEARVLICSSYDTEEDVGRVHNAGARGYVLKEAEGEELLRAVHTVLAGGTYLPPQLAARLEQRAEKTPLTVREVQLLEQLHKGLSNQEIADALSLSANTVRVYLTDLFNKLGARNRTEAVSIALQRGVLRKP